MNRVFDELFSSVTSFTSFTRYVAAGSLSVLTLSLVLLALFYSSPVHTATVEPGEPSTLDLSVPQSSRAGATFTLTVTVRDNEGNVVADYSDRDREILLSTTGDGELSERVIGSGQFEEGRASLSLSYDVAEDLQILARERGHVAAGQSEEFTVRPGPPASFRVDHAAEARAGRAFNVAVSVFDEFGNRVTNYGESTNGVRLETTGLERPSPEFIPAEDFENGRLETSLQYRVAETMRVVLIDEANGVRSLSDTVQIRPGSLNEFTLSVPESARAGVPFRTAVEARDRFGNVVENYSEVGQGVELTVPGGASPEPSYLAPDNFEDGVAFVQVVYNQSGPIRMRAQDRGSSVEGESNEIMIQAGELDHYSLSVPEQVKAGESFTVKIRPRDQFGNQILNYTGREQPVILSVRGREDSRQVVDPSEFSDGLASVEFSHTDASSIRLSATSQENDEVTGQSKALIVSPGDPGDIRINAPESVRAGENFTASVVLTDSHGNEIKETSYLPGKVRVSLVNGSTRQEKVLTPSQFIEGENQLVFRHEAAEEVSVFAEYRQFDVRVKGPGVDVRPADFDHVAVSAPGSVGAGAPFELGVTLLDRFENELRQVPEDLSSIQIVSSGNGNPQPKYVSKTNMDAPSFTVDARYFIAESASLRVLDGRGNRLGVSAPINVNPGDLDSFSFELPDRVPADEDFTLRLQALDAYENTISNLGSGDGLVRLEVTGGTGLNRERIQFSEFSNGVARVPLQYRQAETIELIARTDGVESSSGELTVTPGSPARYEVLTQDRVQAGRPFPAVVRVFDRYDNPITNLPGDFNGVRLSSDSSRSVSPRQLDASLFEEGEANVFLAHPEAGELEVAARPLDSALENPVVDRFYVERDVDTAELYVLASHAVSPTVNRSKASGGDRVRVEFQPADLLSDARTASYDRWFIKKFEQRQAQFGSLPTVHLSLFPNETVTVESNRQDNLTTITATPEATSRTSSLQEIQQLMQEQSYSEAANKLDSYLEENPADQEALQLRLRLKRLRDLVGS